MKNSTFEHARRLGAGADLTDGEQRFLVSDFSPATKQVYGWRLADDGTRGAYMKLPVDLMETRQMAYTAKSLEDIAKAFEHCAWQASAFSDRLHKTQRDRLLAERESQTWHRAAQMIRETTLEGVN